LEWERYGDDTESADRKTTGLGETFTLWVKYRMRLKIGKTALYESNKDTTLVLEDIRRLIDDLRELAAGKKDRAGFDPIEPDFWTEHTTIDRKRCHGDDFIGCRDPSRGADGRGEPVH